MSDRFHIASLLVHVRPEQSQSLLDYLADEPVLEVHAASPDGRLVVVVESPDHQGVTSVIEQLTEKPGVLNCVLIYHETMTSTEGDQVLIDAAVRDVL